MTRPARVRLLLAALASTQLACPKAIRVEERLPPAPPLDRARVDDGPLGKVRRPSRLTADPSQEYDPAVSPDGGVLAYVSHRRGNADVFVRFLPGSGRVGEYPVVDHYAGDSDPTWSPNGRQLAFISRRDDPKGDLYVYNLRSGDRVPDAVRDAILRKFGDALTRPRSELAVPEIEQLDRISTFLEKRDPVVRISGAEREDRGPAWSPDGKTIYYASRLPGAPENVWALDVRAFDAKPLTTEGGFDPAPSPDGKYLVYASRAEDENGGLRVRRLADGATVSLTQDPAIDGFPAFSTAGRTVFFTRYAHDTNEDAKIDVNDRPQIHAVEFRPEALFAPDASLPAPWPVTPVGRYDLFPAVAGGRLFYSSDDGANTDVFAIPEAGIFPALDTGAEELALADQLAGEPELRLLLLEQIVARRPAEEAATQDARLAAARLRAERRQLAAASTMVEAMLEDARVAPDRKARARVLGGRIAVLRALKSGPGGTPDKAALRAAAASLESVASGIESRSAQRGASAQAEGRAAGEKLALAEALFEAGIARELAGDVLGAAGSWQRAVKEGGGWPRAEAWLAAARAYRDLGQADRSVATYIAALQAFPDAIVPAERRPLVEAERRAHVKKVEAAVAASAAAGAHTAGLDPAGLPDVGVPDTYGERAAEGVALSAILGAGGDALNAIAALRTLAAQNAALPVLPSLARNEIGDLYVRIGDTESASQEYAAVAASRGDPRQVQRAHLAAAKALLIAGRYEDAVTALGPPPPDEIPGGAEAVLARRARNAWVRTLLAKADEEFRLRDYRLARKSYRSVLKVDAREVRAHRGLIASYAALGEADRISAIYEDEAEKTPDDPLIRYGMGLAYTYRTPEEKWLARAEPELKRAIFLDDAAVFPHQTLGFVFEKQEELFGEKGGFERAADQYLLALSLNDVREDFRNEADLLLNTGNAFYNLQNYRRAYEYYAWREKTNVPFDLKGRELVFLERFAKCAFESNRIEEAVQRYDRALSFLDKMPEEELPGGAAMEHRARLLDERAFALDRGGKPAEAAPAYLDAAKANSIAGNEQNSARALRNAALALFEKGTDAGEVDEATLVDALGYLEDSLDAVKKHGVVKQTEKPRKKSLFSYDMNFSLSADSSEAIDGFSKQGEQELIFTFVGRIYESLDDPQRARDYYEKKRKMLPKNAADWQAASLAYKRALLENQIGVLAWATGDTDDAWKEISSSWQHSLSLGNVQGGVTNAVNLAIMALETRDLARGDEALGKIDEVLQVLAGGAMPDPERHLSALHAAQGELLLRKAAALRPAAAGKDLAADIRAARAAFEEQHRLVRESEEAFEAARSMIDGAKSPTATMLRDRIAALRGLARIAAFDGRAGDAAKRYAAAAKAARERGLDGIAAQLDVEAAGAAGDDARLAAALAALEKVPAPLLASELDSAGIEPWYRRLAGQALAKGDGTAALAAMERLRALQLVAAAGGAVPKTAASGMDAAAAAVLEAAAGVSRAQRALLETVTPAEGEPWASHRKALDDASAAWAAAVEEWGAWDETVWALAHPAMPDPVMLAAAIPSDAAFVYFAAQPGALWTLTCAGDACTPRKVGPSPGADPAGARAAAAKAVESAIAGLAPGARVFLVPDVGLYDVRSWLPASVRSSHAVGVHRSVAGVLAAWNHRGPYHERVDHASTAGAVAFLAAASRSDVLRLDVPGRVPAGRPLAAAWELSSPDGPPPVRRVTARDVILAVPEVPFIVADVPAKSDPETLLLLSDLWIRAGAGTVVFVDPAQSAQGDAFAKGTASLAATPALLAAGYPGMTSDELAFFGEEALSSTIGLAAAAFREKRWDASLSKFDRALYLVDTLKLKANRRQIVNFAALAAFSAGQWTRGVRYATELVETIEASGETGVPLADALVLLGILHQRAEQFPEAAAALERATQRFKELGSPEGIAKSLTNLGLTHERALEADKALEAFRRAMEVEEQLGRTAGVGSLERKIGRLYLVYMESYADAERHFAAARDAYAKAKDENGVDEAMLEIGIVAERQGRLDDSKRIYGEVHARAVARKDAALQGKAALFLANTAWLSADYQSAFARVREARRIGEETKDLRLQFLARSTEGLLHWTLNDLERAVALQMESLELARKLDSPIDEASTHNNLGVIHRSAHKYKDAIAAFEAALAIDEKLGSRWGQAYDLRNLGLTYLASEQPDLAGEPLQKAVQLAAEIGDRVNGAKATLALGDWHRMRGDAEKARGLYTRALELSKEAHVPEVTWRAHRGLSLVALESRNIARARAELDAALAVVEDLRGAIKVEELKNGFIADKLDLYDDAIRLALDHPEPGTDPALASWTYSERSRARSFIDLLANRKIVLSSKEDTRRIEEQRALKDRVFAAEDALAKAAPADKPAREKELQDLRERYRDLLVEIRATNPKLSAFVTVDPPSLDEVRKVIGKDTALLEYHVASDETIVWTITDSALRVTRIPIGRDRLSGLVTDYLTKMESVRPVDAEARSLFRDLLEPALGKELEEKRFVGIAPHGVLHYMPFAALKDGDRYLIDRYSLFYVPSAAVLPLTAGAPSTLAGPKDEAKVLAIGNPDLGDPSFALPFAELEVSDLELQFSQIDVLTRERATERWVANHIGDYHVIHFACHGEFDPVNPLFSSLRLAREQGVDGALTAQDIFGLPLKAELVTLSACRTGLGKIEAGDELIGLNRAFLYAGTRSIMSTLWRVHDGSTAVLVKHFYRNYTRESKADALRNSMRQVREYYPHPAYWAAFALTGEYR